jgi:hypothetical protein
MKVTRELKFVPVVITLESEDELTVLRSLIGSSGAHDYKSALGGVTGARLTAVDKAFTTLYEGLSK